ncbi:alpha-L-fucosidase [Streptomyces sp. VNUA24]|uniref:alpha-L-fucosidase n=1 Tax=Streptomyces sp. VNUA24 TaxID=3031131 RepID=UPI0023B7AD1A|nr:alpha-L-fucosidase [Streptomyces sp. VNUA24]WEH12826.1 alpha-L-fucosidase [Streptomyces sp. VNUA24]
MPPGSPSRRSVLTAAGVTAAATAMPAFTASSAVAANSSKSALRRLVDMRFGMFNHFNMGTFTDEEWAAPNQSPALFAPPSVDCAQWAKAAKAAGMSYGVLTTKHHDGFCLWPTKYNDYNVAKSGYKRDIVDQYVKAFRAEGLRIGLYFSIWDRSYSVQGYDTRHGVGADQTIVPGDMTYMLNQITELLTNYGEIDMFVTDGYGWQMGQQAVSYQRIREHVKSLQPDIVMIDHGGLSVPFLGDAIYFEEPLGITAPEGNTHAAIQGQTISDGWFWHPSTPKTNPISKASILSHLVDLEPKYTSFILNCPPNRDGRLDDNIVKRLAEVGAVWRPDTSRPKLPEQLPRAEHPVTPVSAYATGFHDGEGPMNAIDGLSDRNFETCWSTWNLRLPHSITIDLGGVWSNVSTLEYLPKQWGRNNSSDGDIISYKISTSTDGSSFTEVGGGIWGGSRALKVVEWSPRQVGFVRIEAVEGTGGYSNMGGVRIGGRKKKPVLVSRVLPGNATVYQLVNRASGKVADVLGDGTANGTEVRQQPWRNQSSQKWTFVSTGDGYYRIRGVSSGKVLEVAGLSRANGGKAGIWSDDSVPQQHWAVTPTGDGYFYLTNRLSGLALNVDNGSTADGADINQWTYTRAERQQWRIVTV